MRKLFIVLICFLSFSINSQQNFYVSSSEGSNANSGTSENSPFQTINRAFDNVKPGDTINVMNGLYHNVDYGTANPHATDGSMSTNMNNPPAVIVNKSGSQGNYITLRNLPGHKPKIKYDGRGGILINGPQSYVIIEGFEIEGPGASITYDQAITDRQWKVKADQENLNYNHSYFASFGIWGGFSQNFLHHHIIIRNNVVHHTTGSGIRFNDSDHITIENNTVYNTTWWTSNASSAIVFAECKAIDSSDNGEDIKMILRGNTVYNNWNRIPFYMTSGQIPPNGNPPSGNYGNADYSTILDGQGLYVTRSDDDYYGTFLFENNLCVNNGKNGINFDRSEGSSALIRNNTIYFNGVHEIIQDISVSEGNPAHRGQKVAGIIANYFKNVTVVNNIVVTREYDFYSMQIRNQQADGTVKEVNNNIFVNGKLPGYTSQQTGEYVIHNWITDDNQIITDVDFTSNNYKDPISFVNAPPIVNGPADMTPTNFQLQGDSPAINAGEQSNTPEKDIIGNPRPLPPSDAVSFSSFESSLGGWSAWSTANDNNEVSLSNENSRTGNQSLKVFGRTKDFHSAKFSISQLEVGNSYTLYIYAKLPEGQSGTAQLMLRKIVDNQSGVSNSLTSPIEINSDQWTKLSTDYTHSEMDSNSFFFVKGPLVSGSDGIDYYLDDFSLVNQGTNEIDFNTVGDIVDIGAYEFFQIDDDDGDGVGNSDDNCPDTPQGTRVDVNGCPVFELPLNNFKVEVGSATCIGNTDGVINLSVEDANYDYSVTVTGQSDLSITGTSTTASVTGLAK
ncbi:MAG: carbohydrate binding domain-containing protein, partial [Flavobacteriaceae bacterium]